MVNLSFVNNMVESVNFFSMAACFVVFYKIENRTQGIAHCKPTYSRGQAKLSTACLV